MQILLTDILWWHWLIFGLILVVAEIIVPSFVVIWFGIAAIVVAVLDWIFDMHFSSQLFWWILFSVSFLYIWFKVYKPATKTKVGEDDEGMGTKGIVIETIKPLGRGRVKFEVPILGSSEWVVTADEEIEKGTQVISVETLGNMIKVKKAI